MADRLYIVVPCYNEQEVLPETSARLREKLTALIAAGKAAETSRVLFVDDGSRDETWSMIAALHAQDKLFSGLKLSRNRGHQNALLAGLMAARSLADVTISMDADLQDDPDVVDAMLEQYASGCDVVYGVRSDRSTDAAFKRLTAQGFYRFLSRMGVEAVYNHADCRLMSRRALDGLAEYGETNLFLRALVPLVGYRSAQVEYKRNPRFAGESKYPLKKMVAFAFDGVTSFSVKPLRLITSTGILIALLSALYSLYSLLAHALAWPWSGWSALMGSVWFLGGLNLVALGLVGQYIGKLYAEVKRRPRYLVETLLDESPVP